MTSLITAPATYRSHTTASEFTATSISLAKPAGLTVGDLMVMIIRNRDGNITSVPSGFTLFQTYDAKIYTKIADSADVAASSFVTAVTGAGNVQIIGAMYAFSAYNTTTPIGVSYSEAMGADNGGDSMDSVTPTYEQSIFILGFTGNAPRTFSNYAFATDNPSWTEDCDISLDSTADSQLAIARAYRAQGTASGTISVSKSGTYNSYTGFVLVINPVVVFDPTVTTQAVSSIDLTSATGNGNVTSDGSSTIIERGVCWSTSPSPTVAGLKSAVSGTTGSFTAPITGLANNTTYYVRAYATNAVGTSYGGEVTFTTLPIESNKVVKDIGGIEGETYAVSVYIGGTVGSVTVQLGTTGASQTFAAGAGTVTLQGVYGGLSGLIFTASETFNGYIDTVMWVLVLGTAPINWSLDTLTNVYPINSSVVFRRVEDKEFDSFRIYRYLDIQFKDLDAYVTVLLKKEANEGLVDSTKEFLVDNVSGQTLPFINKRVSMLLKGQAMRVGLSNNRLNETFTVCQFVLKGMKVPNKLFDKSKIISV